MNNLSNSARLCMVLSLLLVGACSTSGEAQKPAYKTDTPAENLKKLRHAGELMSRPLSVAPVANDEFRDAATGLIWKRCVQGMAWNGSLCEGKAAVGAWMTMVNHANEVAHKEGKHWRMPTAQELNKVSFAVLPFREMYPMSALGLWSADKTSGYFGTRVYYAKIFDNGRQLVESDWGKGRGLWLVRTK